MADARCTKRPSVLGSAVDRLDNHAVTVEEDSSTVDAGETCSCNSRYCWKSKKSHGERLGPDRIRRLTLAVGLVLVICGYGSEGSHESTKSIQHYHQRELVEDIPSYEPNAAYDQNCSLIIGNDSIDNFSKWITREKMKYIRFRIVFSDNINYKASTDVLYVDRWTWTYSGMEASAFSIIQFPFDFDLLSFGLLARQTKQFDTNCHDQSCNVYVNITTQQSGCNLTLGTNQTNVLLQKTFQSLVRQTEYADNSMFCYEHIRNVTRDTSVTWVYLTHFFGVQRDYTNFICCPPPATETGCRMKVNQTSYLWLAQVYGIIIALFSPLFLAAFQDQTASPKVLAHSGRTSHAINSVEDEVQILRVAEDASEYTPGEWIYFNHNPVSFARVLRYVTCQNRNSRILRRVWRIVFVLLSLTILVFKIILYNVLKREDIEVRLNNFIPVGSLCVPFGYKPCLINSAYFIGGPIVYLPLFVLLSSILLCIPDSIPDLFLKSQELQESTTSTLSTYLYVTDGMLENQKLIRKRAERRGYARLVDKLKERCCMLLNKKFWCCFFHMWRHRFFRYNLIRACLSLDEQSRCGKVVCILCAVLPTVVIMVFLAVACIFEMIAVILYYGCPLVFFYKLCTSGMVRLTMDTLSLGDHSQARINRAGYLQHCRSLISGLTAVVLLVAILYCITIGTFNFIVSFTFIVQLTTFTFIGVIAHPEAALTYMVAGLAILYYLVKSVGTISTGYLKLLRTVIHVSQCMQNRKWRPYFDEPQDEEYHARYIRENKDDLTLGVPRGVYDHVVDHVRPLRVQVFVAFMKLAITANIIYSMVSLTQSFHTKDNINLTTRTLAVVFVGLMPEVLGVFTSKFQTRLNEEAMEKKVERLIKEYWQEDANTGCAIVLD